jgi:hypothetical protein
MQGSCLSLEKEEEPKRNVNQKLTDKSVRPTQSKSQAQNPRNFKSVLLHDDGVACAFPAAFLGPVEGEDDLRADWEGGGGQVEDVGVEAGVAGGSVL